MKHYYELPAGIVIQRSSFVKQTTDEMCQAINLLKGVTVPVRVVENAVEFFSNNNLMRCVDNGDIEAITLIMQHRGIAITDEELSDISAFAAFKADLQTRLDAIKPVYEFAEVPDDWNFANQIRITTKGVYRVGNSDYKLSLAQAEDIWKKASRVWAGLDQSKNIGTIRASGYSRSASIDNNSVTIGCQTIRRYEWEQLALNQGWEMPS